MFNITFYLDRSGGTFSTGYTYTYNNPVENLTISKDIEDMNQKEVESYIEDIFEIFKYS